MRLLGCPHVPSNILDSRVDQRVTKQIHSLYITEESACSGVGAYLGDGLGIINVRAEDANKHHLSPRFIQSEKL